MATSVNRVLREQFGLAVDAGRVQVVEESVPLPDARRPAPDSPAAAPPVAERAASRRAAAAATGLDDEPTRPTLTAVPEYQAVATTVDDDLTQRD